MSIKQAFFSECQEARPAQRIYVSLYVQIPYYGGPEEGGWWGEDVALVASQHVNTQEHADAVVDRIKVLAEKLSDDERRKFGDRCLAEMEWLDARGLDADYLPEVDGESRYFVITEDIAGSSESVGSRYYE